VSQVTVSAAGTRLFAAVLRNYRPIVLPT